MNQTFDHEKLHVYQEAIRFARWASRMLGDVPKSLAVHGQLDRAATSISLNIAEGNGKFRPADRCRFFDTARSSALECAACLDVLAATDRIPVSEIAEGKKALASVVSMLVGLIKATSTTRVHEGVANYDGEEGSGSD
jgi:four helix bundle protein